MMKRGRGDDGQDLQEFFDRDRRELKWGIGNAFALADGMLVNEGSLDEFRRQARQALERILAREDEG
jgi:dephospho-CoA kinase